MSTLLKLPRFASSGATVEPSEGKKDLGWVGSGEKPPFQTFNWLHKTTFEFLSNINAYSLGYASVDQFCEFAEPGDVGVVNTFAPAFDGGVLHTTANGKSIDSDAQYWLICTAAVAQLRARAAIDTLVRTYTPTEAVTNMFKAVTNGRHVALIHDTWLEVFNRDTGVLSFKHNHGGSLTDVCIDNFRVYACGATSGSKTVFARLLSDGTEAWAVNHDATVNSICTDGVRVYYGGNGAGAGATAGITAGNHIVDLIASTGAIARGLTASTVAGANRMACDGTDIYAVASTTAIKRYDRSLNEIGSYTLASVLSIAADNDYFYCATASITYAMDRNFDAPREISGRADALCSDGELVAVCNASSPYTDVINRPVSRVRKWRKTKTDDAYMPHARLAIPVE